ncbi:MAG: NAD(P)/FAD-dependent oxidoreductase, partial [Clostridia bacterium]|nr:NAD(P)/FAD-dependent oxidoreductase [Clostridia bacterium]
MKVVVIGGGPAGMMSAITAAEKGDRVILLEKMNALGRKLLITGKGRCNITSSLDIKDFISNVPGNGKFLYSSFQNYTNNDIVNFLKKQGVQVK